MMSNPLRAHFFRDELCALKQNLQLIALGKSSVHPGIDQVYKKTDIHLVKCIRSICPMAQPKYIPASSDRVQNKIYESSIN